jgi:hypothetical protein
MSTEVRLRERGYFSSAIRKILLTALIGGLAYLLTNLTKAPQIWQLTLSVFIGGVVLVVQFLADFDDRLEHLEREQHAYLRQIRELVDRGFLKISEATELFALMEESPVHTESVTELIRHSTEIPRATPQLIYDLTQMEIGRLSLFLKNLGKGVEVTYPGEDRDWLIALASSAQTSIYATSMSAVDAGGRVFGGGFWNSDLGRRYLEIQRSACQRGVEIRRIFIVDPREPSSFEEMYSWQASLGIDVRILRPDTDIATPWKSWLQDFIVFDDVVSYEAQTAPQVGDEAQPTFVNTRLVLEPGQVKERRERFQDLWAAATPFVPGDRP